MIELVAALVRAVQHAGVAREPGNGERRIGRRPGQGLRSAVARGECIGVEDAGLVRADKELAVVRRPGVAAREGVRRRREECLGIVAVWSRRSGRRIGRRGGTLAVPAGRARSEEHTSELQSLMRISYAVFCLKKKNILKKPPTTSSH